MISDNDCPCGSGMIYSHCCQPFHSGNNIPVTAEALMRSRYTAYVLHNAAYLLATWEEDNRPDTLDFSEPVIWSGLEIIDTQKGGAEDNKGIVVFKASFIDNGEKQFIHESSRFIKHQGRWFYVNGVVKESRHQSKNALCLCGSGKKFKRCCGVSG